MLLVFWSISHKMESIHFFYANPSKFVFISIKIFFRVNTTDYNITSLKSYSHMLKPHISTHLWTAKIMQSEAPTTLSAPADLSYELKFPLRRYFRKLWESHREY